MASGTNNWTPNEDFMQCLMGMGISASIARNALYNCCNESVEAAVECVYCADRNDGLLTHSESSDTSAENEPNDEKSYKMVFVVNMGLKMGVGKVAAQTAHACLGLYRQMIENEAASSELHYWEYIGEKKVVLRGNDHNHLQELFEQAKESNVPCYLVQDAGKTQIPAGSVTVLSLFGLEEQVNKITGSLGLL